MLKQWVALSLLGLFAIGVFSACGEQRGGEARIVVERDVDETPGWFTATSVGDRIWRIEDHGSDNMYLVEGDEKALLIDTGTGVGDLAACVRSITDKPFIVVNTHGHPDHAGGNFQFEEVYVHPSDFEMASRFNSPEYHRNTLQRVIDEMPEVADVILSPDAEMRPFAPHPLKAGDRFDLVGRTLEVIEVPGHTPGSIALLDAENKLLFAGDSSNIPVWLFLDASLPLADYLVSLERLEGRSGDFETIFPGHREPLDRAFLGELTTCVRSILDGTCEPQPYSSFAGDASQCSYKRATVAFDPARLQ